MAACLSRPIEPVEPSSTTIVHEKLPRSRIDKIDLLLMIDNSASMGDKQAILADAVPDLVKGLVSPLCLDDKGAAVPAQPARPIDPCPPGSEREFEPVLDIHIGVISSSLGSYGTGTCSVDKSPSNDDEAHLLARKDPSLPPSSQGNQIATYQSKGFLAWDPAGSLTPPGITEVGDDESATGLVPTLREMVKGVGQSGCGYEAQLESWYRFLVDPEPYKTIALGADGHADKQGVDDVLLAQRGDFLRPDSLVAVVMLTDENDCSFKDGGMIKLGGATRSVADKDLKLPRARHECSVNPDDPCCKSCGAPQGTCPDDPTCSEPLPAEESDGSNLRCFHQKERFGFDFLYPLDRYTQAIQRDKVLNRSGDLVQNPLYPTAEDSHSENPRTPDSGLVFVAGIVGVPWQDIARRDALGKPDLLRGLDQKNQPVGGFKSVRELSQPDASGVTAWDHILGDPAHNVAPKDPLMIESRKPREGITEATGEAIASMNAESPTANAVNGHEYDTFKTDAGELQYACIFKLPSPQEGACTAMDIEAKNPLCQDDSGQYTQMQYRAKAYPGLRELGVLKGLGDQGIVASVCPAQLDATDRQDYGYRPAMGAIVDRLKQKLTAQCLNRSLTPDEHNPEQVACVVLEAQKLEPGQTCDCEGLAAREPVQEAHKAAVTQALEDPVAEVTGWDCFCEVKQLSGEALHVCQNDMRRKPLLASGEPIDGWCYIDATTLSPIGNPALVDSCASTERREIRFVGEGEQRLSTTRFITCRGR